MSKFTRLFPTGAGGTIGALPVRGPVGAGGTIGALPTEGPRSVTNIEPTQTEPEADPKPQRPNSMGRANNKLKRMQDANQRFMDEHWVSRRRSTGTVTGGLIAAHQGLSMIQRLIQLSVIITTGISQVTGLVWDDKGWSLENAVDTLHRSTELSHSAVGALCLMATVTIMLMSEPTVINRVKLRGGTMGWLLATMAVCWAISSVGAGNIVSQAADWASPFIQTITACTAIAVAPDKWQRAWLGIYAAEDKASAYRAMTVKFLCNDGVTRRFLFDTGASASLLPFRLFRKACQRCNLLPPRHRLRAANGMVMDNQGSAEMELRLPGSHLSDPPIAVHRFEVLGDKAMPPSLQILGVDFWDQLNPQTDWKRRTINCCNKEGVEFQLEFDVGTVDNRDRDQHTVHAVQGDRKADQSERGSGASQERFELYAATDVRTPKKGRACTHRSGLSEGQ
jgi:hypothetical protein